MRHLLLTFGLLLGTTAMAEDPSPPPVVPTEVAEPALPPAFLDQALKVDGKNQVKLGRGDTPLTHRELFVKLQRTDLLEKSDLLATRRKWLIIGAVGVSSAAIVAGVILLATAPVLASVECEASIDIYNNVCVPRAAAHNISGTAVIATGVLSALLMAGFAFNSDPNVLDRDQTASLVSNYNSKLARQLRRPPAGLRLLPIVTPDGASLTASLRF